MVAREADDLKELDAGVFKRPDHLVMEVAGGQVQVVGEIQKPETLEGLAEFTSDNSDIALGRGNWTFFGSDGGGQTAAVLRSFIASCKRCGVEPFAWFHDVLSRIPAHSITRLTELLPHNWKPAISPAQA